ncbi:hypothetical protein [Nonlabens ulvanivorans]|uniref:Lipoprotein n=2 Tax=Nonlabens ulvanivorans TaxID=906888 RepID=A0A084JXD4_NONUL|nr:hypothetical protein [Nonlabens ulvanivorans]KEZ93618.1 hypothetical protein IL45_05275 [Nonlabens ulvanivorans]PRX14204.1 hypothetical protein LY02_01234 [Nonlabens ulvanivorans]
MRKLLLLLVLIAFLSCKQEKNTILEIDTPFDYTSYLLSHSDSVPTLEIKFDQPDSLVFVQLNEELMPDGCETSKDFNLKIDSLTIAARFQQPCDMPMFCGLKLNVEVLINRDNQILVEQEFVNDTSDLLLKIDRVIKNKNEYAYKNRTGLIIIRDKKADLSQSKLVIQSFVASYNKYMDSIALNRFYKNLEKLNLKELDELKKERILVLEYWNYPKPRIPERQELKN